MEEYKTFYWSWQIPPDLAIEIFPKLDLDGDGSITKKEFLKLVREFHRSDDPNASGNLFFCLLRTYPCNSLENPICRSLLAFALTRFTVRA
ncbi:MAG: hypothetical protein F6K17_17830 [Okeania sp. SIO3C4]|nr:hypothetical protein [Okeania sp. SIO3C4]